MGEKSVSPDRSSGDPPPQLKQSSSARGAKAARAPKEEKARAKEESAKDTEARGEARASAGVVQRAVGVVRKVTGAPTAQR